MENGTLRVNFTGHFGFIPRNPQPHIVTITQEGTKFTAVKQIGNKWLRAGSETIKGELDKNGFKAVYAWGINEKENKALLDSGERVKSTLTRS